MRRSLQTFAAVFAVLGTIAMGRDIDANSSLSAAARAHAVNTLLDERFTPQERLRVEALETFQQESGR